MLLQGSPLPVGENRNEKSSKGRNDGAPLQPPVGRRILFLWGSIALLFPSCYLGSKFIDGGKKGIGNTLVFSSYSLFGAGLALIVLSGFGGVGEGGCDCANADTANSARASFRIALFYHTTRSSIRDFWAGRRFYGQTGIFRQSRPAQRGAFVGKTPRAKGRAPAILRGFDSLNVVQIRVLFFGLLKDICGGAEERLELPAGATAGAVFEHYAAMFPTLRQMASSIVLARNHEFTPVGELLSDGDEVALLPPVSGGSLTEIGDPEGHFFALTRAPIDLRNMETRLLQGCDGASVTFQGVVRNNTSGRTTLRLEYECYEPMAIRKMAEIGREIASQCAITRIGMVHRLGTMEIGEASVAIVVAAPHRKAAFEAALEGINRLKRLVPVWKKEFFEDGEVWVEGDWDRDAPRVSAS
jgi:molybdopterin converting factor subunit 1